MRRSGAGYILGYHGCSEETAERLLGGDPFIFSKNPYDWLGWGAYFWENDPERAQAWAAKTKERAKPGGQASVVGAVIDPGWCLDLTTQASLDVIRAAYDGLSKVALSTGEQLIENTDSARRERDCAVLNFLHESMPAPKFQTVRGVFVEGGPLYDGAHIPAQTHVQWAVRDLTCIKGVFRI